MRKKELEAVFRRHYGEMKRLARMLLYDDEEAEDAVQDVFVRLIESDISLAEDKMRAYLLAAVRNGCINRIRQKSMVERVRNLYSMEAESDFQHVDECLRMCKSVCDYADNHLKEPHRTIFRLRFEEGLTLKEIAQRLDMNLKTVFKYLSQSIQSIQRQFRY